jgi:hypothetical protein
MIQYAILLNDITGFILSADEMISSHVWNHSYHPQSKMEPADLASRQASGEREDRFYRQTHMQVFSLKGGIKLVGKEEKSFIHE